MSTSSRAWCQRQAKDPFVQQALKEGWRSRAVYKLQEIQAKDRLFKPGMQVVDLGAAPGSWSQAVVKWIGKNGQLWALDILPMDALPGVNVLQGDFTEESTYHELQKNLAGQQLDWVISDMAPNMSGIRAADQARSMLLIEYALDFAREFLKPGGGLLVKAFDGAGLQNYVQSLRPLFTQVVYRKPKASRDKSREVYILAKGWRA